MACKLGNASQQQRIAYYENNNINDRWVYNCLIITWLKGWIFTLDYPMPFLLLSTWDRGDHSEPFLLFEFCCGTPPSCLKVEGWWVVGGGGLQHFSVSPRPLAFGFGTKGFGGKKGLTICGVRGTAPDHLHMTIRTSLCTQQAKHQIWFILMTIAKKSFVTLIFSPGLGTCNY